MEVNNAERVVIAKPIASRPTCSSFRSFSELLAGAITASSYDPYDTAVPAIRPKTVRLKPAPTNALFGMPSSQAGISGAAACYSSDRGLKPDRNSTVVYKPLAKLVSKSTVPLLANLGDPCPCSSNQKALTMDEAHVHHYETHLSSDFQQNLLVAATDPTIELPKTATQNFEDNQKHGLSAASGDRPCYDGYNWRKYGQKQVKGSEYPRSYYKCTHPNCPVKKKVERSFDGKIAEIVYKGEHNHMKPQPPKRGSSGAQCDGNDHDQNDALWNNGLRKWNVGIEGRKETRNGVDPTFHGKASSFQNDALATSDNSCGLTVDCEEASKEVGVDEPKNKRRRSEDETNEASALWETVQDPGAMLPSPTDLENASDGFRWRKYGQKVVKGNPYPRSYYRCTVSKCNVRKHVERSPDDPRAFITTYEGKHNHDMPIRFTDPAPSEPDLWDPSKKAKA